MTTDTMLRCALGVGDRTLSDFRSDGLTSEHMQHLRTHVAECPACQARLDEFEMMAQALRAQPEPNDHARLWRNVWASIAADTLSVSARQRQRRHARAGAHAHSTRFWAAFGSIAAVVALSAGFIGLFVSRGGWPPAARTTATVTPQVIHSGSLTWKRLTVPQGFPSADQAGDAATNTAALIAPTDGRTAYACQGDRHRVSSPVVWATHDAGESWSVITPGNLPANAGGCRIILDGNDANTLIVSFYPVKNAQEVPNPNTWVTYATFDGGRSWSKPAGLRDGNVTYIQATAGDKIYAVRGNAGPDGTVTTTLYISRDQMQTWTRIDDTLPVPEPGPDAHALGRVGMTWVDAASGEVLIETYTQTLWITQDDGAHWSEVPYPDGMVISSLQWPLVTIGPPTTSAHLTICGVIWITQPGIATRLTCTTDNGQRWKERPSATLLGISKPTLTIVSLGADGSIYAVGPWSDSNSALEWYRLPPNATKLSEWQRLGAIPNSQSGSNYGAGLSGAGMEFWLLPFKVTATDSDGNTTTTLQPYYYVAVYP